jgi:hypothetical protein
MLSSWFLYKNIYWVSNVPNSTWYNDAHFTEDKDNDCVDDDDLLVISVMVLKTMKATYPVDVNDNEYDDEEKANDDKVDIDDKKNSDDDKNDDGIVTQ